MPKYSQKPRHSLRKKTDTPYRPFIPAPENKNTTYNAISDTIECLRVHELIKSYPDGKGGYYHERQPERKTKY